MREQLFALYETEEAEEVVFRKCWRVLDRLQCGLKARRQVVLPEFFVYTYFFSELFDLKLLNHRATSFLRKKIFVGDDLIAQLDGSF